MIDENMVSESFKTDSNIPVKRAFTKNDLKKYDNHLRKEEAGRFPYTRGLYSNMYRERLWTMRQYSGFGGAEETNKRFKFLLDHGQTGLSLAFDLPTQTGRDSDDPQSGGEVQVVCLRRGSMGGGSREQRGALD